MRTHTNIKAAFAVVLAVVFIALTNSCKKESTKSTPNFQGTYYGYIYRGWDCATHDCHSLNNDTVTVSAGSTSTAMNLSCKEPSMSYTLTGVITGDTINIPTQSYNGGNIYAYAFIKSDSLIIESYATPGPVFGYFAGKKQ